MRDRQVAVYWVSGGFVHFLTMSFDKLSMLYLARQLRAVVPDARLFVGEGDALMGSVEKIRSMLAAQ